MVVSEGLFKLNVLDSEINEIVSPVLSAPCSYVPSSSSSSISGDTWHARLGHINSDCMKRMMTLNLIPKICVNPSSRCEICVQAKFTRKPFKSVNRSTSALQLVHSDVCDSNRIPTRGGNKYFVTFIDDYSKFCYVYLLKTKDEVLDKFKIYKAEVENQLGSTLKTLRSDRGGEYTSNELTQFCQEHGIVHQVTAPYSPQSNGVAERKNRTLMNMVNAMLSESGAPENLWGEALLTACNILNKIPPKHSDKIPYELFKLRKPNLLILRVWGCLAKVGIPDPKRKKIGPKTVDAIFVGYASGSNANRFLVVNSQINDISNNTMMEARDAVYFEDKFSYKTKTSSQPSSSSSQPAPEDDSDPEPIAEPRRSKRSRIERNFGDDYFTYLVEGDPNSYAEAMASFGAPF